MKLTPTDYSKCIETITKVTDKLEADFANIDDLDELDPTKEKSIEKTQEDIVAHLMIRKRPKSVEDLLEIRVAVVGNVDAGKVKKNIFPLQNDATNHLPKVHYAWCIDKRCIG